MRRRTALALSAGIAALFLPLFASSAHADEPDCTTVFFDVTFGQGVEEFCPDTDSYQVIAQCDDGGDVWTVPGTFAEPGSGPSIATCRGALLFPAHVLTYYLVR
jgi:hypothetical protein